MTNKKTVNFEDFLLKNDFDRQIGVLMEYLDDRFSAVAEGQQSLHERMTHVESKLDDAIAETQYNSLRITNAEKLLAALT